MQLKTFYDESKIFINYSYLTPVTKINNKYYKKLINYLLSKKYLVNKSSIIEVGSNNGLFLKLLNKYSNDVIGIDPSKIASIEAKKIGVKTINAFFNRDFLKKYQKKKRFNNLQACICTQ